MEIHMYGDTDTGLVRASNQDALFFEPTYGLAVVSDGMGGHRGGEVASGLVIDGIRSSFFNTPTILMETVEDYMDQCLKTTNENIVHTSETQETLRGMGATVEYLHFTGDRLFIGHAGDSRTYLIRRLSAEPTGMTTVEKLHKDFAMWQLTIDHNVETFLQRGLLRQGFDLPLGTLSKRQLSRLTRCMGISTDMKWEIYQRPLKVGDVYLTCSDGLHGFVSPSNILKAVVSGPVATAHERLIKQAKKAGAPDNVTIVISMVCETSLPNLHNPWDLTTPEETGPEPFFTPAEKPRDVETQVGKKSDAPSKSKYLVRTPDRCLEGPFSVTEILDGILAHTWKPACEVAGPNNSWVKLTHPAQLWDTYPAFKTSKYRQFLSVFHIDYDSQEKNNDVFLANRFQNLLNHLSAVPQWVLVLCIVSFAFFIAGFIKFKS